MFSTLLQRLARRRDEHPCTEVCEELNELMRLVEIKDYETAVEFMIFESTFNPDKAVYYIRRHARSYSGFERLGEAFLLYVNTTERKEYFTNPVVGETNLRIRVEQLTAFLTAVSCESIPA